VSTDRGTTGGITAGQTIGPFFAFGLPFTGGGDLVAPWSPGSVLLSGTVTDGAGAPVPDALIEIWQPSAAGAVSTATGSLHRDGVTFTGFGRAATDPEGRFRFWTVEPGRVEGSEAAPFIAVAVFARGLLDALHTRIYLPDDSAALESDPLLASLSAAERETLVARRDADGQLVHDIRLQGEQETVFLVYR
jgi:protocatechuate 3,4-dioxygenase alpha subunit